MATIRARGNYSAVTAIDGKPVPFGTGAMQVEPGEHDVSATRATRAPSPPAPA